MQGLSVVVAKRYLLPMIEKWLITRPGKDWTLWADGRGEPTIERTWWQAKALHFPKDNVSHWYDGSELVGIEKWGVNGDRWAMKKPPADWEPAPPGYRENALRAWEEWRAGAADDERMRDLRQIANG